MKDQNAALQAVASEARAGTRGAVLLAGAAGAVLLVDEADALFGQRTGVKDSHDRYANIETGYLLARLEEYNGIVLLATNLGTNIDAAFTRRLRRVIDYTPR